jgi:hypothetical protein
MPGIVVGKVVMIMDRMKPKNRPKPQKNKSKNKSKASKPRNNNTLPQTPAKQTSFTKPFNFVRT